MVLLKNIINIFLIFWNYHVAAYLRRGEPVGVSKQANEVRCAMEAASRANLLDRKARW